MSRLHLLSLLTALTTLSCSSSTESNPIYPPSPLPISAGSIFTGLYIVFENGTFGGTVGTPGDGRIMPDAVNGTVPPTIAFTNPYPNPAPDSIWLRFRVPTESTVTIQIAAEAPRGEPGQEGVTAAGAIVHASPLVVVKTLIFGRLSAGDYNLSWNGTDDQGRLVPTGYYRVYAGDGKALIWHDVFLARNYDEVPAEIRRLLRGI